MSYAAAEARSTVQTFHVTDDLGVSVNGFYETIVGADPITGFIAQRTTWVQPRFLTGMVGPVGNSRPGLIDTEFPFWD